MHTVQCKQSYAIKSEKANHGEARRKGESRNAFARADLEPDVAAWSFAPGRHGPV